jgi:hypothetical protein
MLRIVLHVCLSVFSLLFTCTQQPSAKILVPPVPPVSQTKTKTGTTLRRGKWTVEEGKSDRLVEVFLRSSRFPAHCAAASQSFSFVEAYVARVIQDFNSGFLNAPAGTTLRSYLSEKLQCDPMRITKKFTGDSCIGKRVFHPAVRNTSNASAIDKAQVGNAAWITCGCESLLCLRLICSPLSVVSSG